jgi:5-formyltetrahydrofolate cyclo-ligase
VRKKEIRIHFLEKRKAISPAKHTQWSQQIAASVLEGLMSDQKWIHVFLPMASKAEVATQELMASLWRAGKKVVVPKVQPKVQLSHHLWTPSTPTVINQWGIAEPVGDKTISAEQLDVVLVPLLAIDQDGQRVGYGKGFYDRFLASCRPDIVRMGIGFFPPIAAIADIQRTDIPLDSYTTQEKTYFFKTR